jgi:hemerythrin-like metal-binding protein
MEPIIYLDDWDLGIELIDEQHRGLVDLINRLMTMRDQEESTDLVAEALEELSEYIFCHFHEEEVLMEYADYPGLEAHRQLHGEFVQKVLNYQKRFRQGEKKLEAKMLVFLSGWLVSHIQGEDARFAPYVHARGDQNPS